MGEVLAEQLQSALNSRVVIEQAKGAIAQFRNVSVDEAFVLLRDHAHRTKQRLGDVAHAALDDPASLADTPYAPSGMTVAARLGTIITIRHE